MAASYADDICPSLAYSLLSMLEAIAGTETAAKVVLPTNASLPLYTSPANVEIPIRCYTASAVYVTTQINQTCDQI